MLVFLLVLLLQMPFASSSQHVGAMGGGWTRTRGFGLGSPIIIRQFSDAPSELEVREIALVLNLCGSALLAAMVAGVLGSVVGMRRPGLAFTLATVVILLLAFLAAIGVSRWYWGYFFQRPPPLEVLEQVEQLRYHAFFDERNYPRGPENGQKGLESILERIPREEHDEYYWLTERLVVALADRGVAIGATTCNGELTELLELLEPAGIHARSQDGYNSQAHLHGMFLDTMDRDGNRLVIAGIRGGQVSNDHYPYYEVAFRPGPDGRLQVAEHQRFFYDIAGFEGLEWPSLFLIFGSFGLVVGWPLFTLVLLANRLLGRSSEPDRHRPITRRRSSSGT